ncbi:NPCBM/NEW2 domain-containing protein [bacterium]|nr:NPCBM/NEW2 domain-containing protein [bacterium]
MSKTFGYLAIFLFVSALAAQGVPTAAEVAYRYFLKATSNNWNSTTITNLPPLERSDLPPMPPQLIAGDEYFTGRTKVILALPTDGSKIKYTLDGSPANEFSLDYAGDIVLTDSAKLRAVIVSPGGKVSPELIKQFNQVGLRNGNFESGGEFPDFWGSSGSARFVYEKNAGLGGSKCVSIASDDLCNAYWTQTIKVKPFTPYVLKGSIRLSGVTGDSEYCIATIGGYINAKSETGPKVGSDPNAGWTEYTVDVMTGNTHEVKIVCRLGDLDIEDNQGGMSKGKVYFDNLSFEENTEVTIFRGKYVILPLYKEIIKTIGGPSVAQAMVRNTEAAFAAMKDLTGWAPEGAMEVFPIWTPMHWSIRAGGWSGCPILVTPGFYSSNWRHAKENLVSGVFVHEGAHNYNNGLWSPSGHEYTHALLQMYAVNGAGLTVDDQPWSGTTPNGHTWFKPAADAERKDGFSMGPWQYAMKMWDMGETLGWQYVKKAFRDFHEMEHPPLKTQNEKINFFIDRLSAHSGHDVRKEFFTPEQWDFFMSLHGTRPSPIMIEEVDIDATNVYLAYIKWEKAKSKSLDKPEAKSAAARDAVYNDSLTAQAPTYYIYRLNGGWKKFVGKFGFQRGKKGEVKFEIYGDDKRLFSSKTKNDSAHSFNVDVSGVQILRLETVNLGEEDNPKVFWFDPELIRDDQLAAMKKNKAESSGQKVGTKRPVHRPTSRHVGTTLQHQDE